MSSSIEIPGFWRSAPGAGERVALIEPDGTAVAARDLWRGGNQLAHALRAAGLGTGDVVAVLLPNGRALFEALLATMQIGLRLTPINTHLTASEVAYILADAPAAAFVTHERLAAVARAAADDARVPADRRIAVGSIDGFRAFDAFAAGQPPERPSERQAGQILAYTSGTTGRPRSVRRKLVPVDPDLAIALQATHLFKYDVRPGDGHVHLVASPMYHMAPLIHGWYSLHLDHPVVLMDGWDAEATLRLVERHRVTTTHLVPTQLHRLLALPEEARQRYDLSSLRAVVHAAAPCPVEVKRRILEWWGPIVYEYYGSTEGGGTLVRSDEWLSRPGTVGRVWQGGELKILDEDGNECPAGVVGTVYMRSYSDFEYGGDPEKTRAGRRGGLFTAGDMGYLDSEGYLFLCDRKIDLIISGGVNIYPAEVEGALLAHPKVADVAVFGIPHPDWGEEVKAVVQPEVGVAVSAAFVDELMAHCVARLARYKIPRSFDFTEALPRDPSGKLMKRKLRDPYWQGRGRAI